MTLSVELVKCKRCNHYRFLIIKAEKVVIVCALCGFEKEEQ